MQIEIVIPGWAQQCCGAPFRLGEAMTKTVLATDPAQAPAGAPRGFEEAHHDLTPQDVPQWDVVGRVLAITGLQFLRVSLPGHKGAFVLDRTQPQEVELNAVETSAADDPDEYRVTLEVSDATELPPYVLSAQTTAQRERDRAARERNAARRQDDVGVLLEALADDAQNRYGNIAHIARSTTLSAMTIEPCREDAAAVRWARADAADEEGGDGIVVYVGEGVWRLAATVADAHLVREFVEAAAAGRVMERVRVDGAQSIQVETEVRAADGRTWTATAGGGHLPAEAGSFGVLGTVWDRVQRGDRSYEAWGTRAQQ